MFLAVLLKFVMAFIYNHISMSGGQFSHFRDKMSLARDTGHHGSIPGRSRPFRDGWQPYMVHGFSCFQENVYWISMIYAWISMTLLMTIQLYATDETIAKIYFGFDYCLFDRMLCMWVWFSTCWADSLTRELADSNGRRWRLRLVVRTTSR